MTDSLVLGNLIDNSLDTHVDNLKNKKFFDNKIKKKTISHENDIIDLPLSKNHDVKEWPKKEANFRTSKLFDEHSKNIPEFTPAIKTSKYEELFSDVNFDNLNLDKLLVACLQQRFSLSKATKVQALSIPIVLKGKDVLIKSVTGSGKTLAYSLPLIHMMQSIKPEITRSDGLFALIILPTRELAIQTFNCIDRLLNPFRRIVIGLMIGGEKKKSEKARIRKGLNIIVTTPGRLLDHINRTKNLNLEKIKWLIIDEADRLYEQGFSAIIGQIIECIKNSCQNTVQTILLSATLSEGVKELAGLSLNCPEFIDVGNNERHLDEMTLPKSLNNTYMIVPPKLLLLTLSCILLNTFNSKSNHSKMIIFTSCQDVLHGSMTQISRTEIFKKFHSCQHGILFCTDVASRGLDLPNVDLVVHINPPATVEDFVHRAGRTARVGNEGTSILILLPSEVKYIEYIQEQLSVNFQSIKMETYFKSIETLNISNENLRQEQRLIHLQQTYERTVLDDQELYESAGKAYLSYLRAYATYPRQLSRYLPFKGLHLGHLAKSFALRDPPKELAAKMRKRKIYKKSIESSHSLKRKSIIPLEERISEFGGLETMNESRKKRRIKK